MELNSCGKPGGDQLLSLVMVYVKQLNWEMERNESQDARQGIGNGCRIIYYKVNQPWQMQVQYPYPNGPVVRL